MGKQPITSQLNRQEGPVTIRIGSLHKFQK